MSLKAWLLQLRPTFLSLSVVVVFLGAAVAWKEGFFDFTYFILSLAGMLLVSVSCFVLDDYFDYKSGLDLQTRRTPFSGGSGILPSGLLKPKAVYRLGLCCLLLASLIGFYLSAVRGWLLLPLLVIGGAATYFYSTHLSKWMVGELLAGLNFGPLAILGSYFVQTGGYSWSAFVTSLAPGILMGNLLLLNQFPDVTADEKVGRRNLVIALGKRKASRLYVMLLTTAYFCIVYGVAVGLMPPPALIGILSIPASLKAAESALKDYDEPERLLQAMKANIVTVIATPTLLAIGYSMAAFLPV